MTTKGQRTRERVVASAAPVFNRQGYAGASLRDVMDATGLEKGGIYNHFSSKDELAVAAFEHNAERMGDLIRGGLAGHRHAVDRLLALIEVYRRFATDPPFPGGCPLLNTAVEADDAHPLLRRRAQARFGELLDDTFARIVERGVERGELAADTDPRGVASVIVSAIEGALMLNQLFDDVAHVERTADHLARYVRSLAARDDS